MTYDVGNPDPVLGQAQNYGSLNQLMKFPCEMEIQPYKT